MATRLRPASPNPSRLLATASPSQQTKLQRRPLRRPLRPAPPIFRLPQPRNHLATAHRKQPYPSHLHRRISAKQSQPRQKIQAKNPTARRAACSNRHHPRRTRHRRPSPYPSRKPSPNPTLPQHHPLPARAKRSRQKNQPQPPIRRPTAGCLPRPQPRKTPRPSPCPRPIRQLANRPHRRISRHRPPAIRHLQSRLYATPKAA